MSAGSDRMPESEERSLRSPEGIFLVLAVVCAMLTLATLVYNVYEIGFTRYFEKLIGAIIMWVMGHGEWYVNPFFWMPMTAVSIGCFMAADQQARQRRMRRDNQKGKVS